MKARRSTIGADPLDSVVPVLPIAREGATGTSEPSGVSGTSAARAATFPFRASRATAKVRATFHVSAALLEEARDAVVALSGPPTRLTLAELAERALRHELERLKREHHEGRAFPRRSDELRGGRPIRNAPREDTHGGSADD